MAHRDLAAYQLSEAARYLKLPVATLRSWVVGRSYPTGGGPRRFQPLIRPASRTPLQLSFWNLVEAHVLRALRAEHAIKLRAVRQAIGFAERELRIDQLLLRRELRSNAGELFLEKYGELISLSQSGQYALKEIFHAHLDRVEWGTADFPLRLYPWVGSAQPAAGRPIVIDPEVAFGRPVVGRRMIGTAAIAARIDAGEAPEELARDYGLSVEEVGQAAVYEHAA